MHFRINKYSWKYITHIRKGISLQYRLSYMSTLSERIRWVMQEYGLTQTEISKIAGVSQPSVNRWLNGEVEEIKATAALRICKKYPVLLEWLISGEGTPTPTGTSVIPCFPEETDPPEGFVFVKAYRVECAAGDGRFECEPDETVEGKSYRASWLQKRGYQAERLKIFKVVGDSMAELLCDGDSITVNTAETEVISGKVYAFCFNGGFRVKRLRRLMNGGLSVHSDNPQWSTETIPPDEMECVHIIGRVVDRSGSGGL